MNQAISYFSAAPEYLQKAGFQIFAAKMVCITSTTSSLTSMIRYLLSKDCLYNNPKVFYEFYRQKLDVRNIEPNITHYVLTKLEQIGKLKAIVTQNIDGLHQKAGSKIVYEIHGTTQRNYCSKCGKEYNSDFLFDTDETIPKCTCRGLIRPDVTLYGEMLPEKTVKDACDAISAADMLIIGGTSLQVQPARSFIYEFCGGTCGNN